MHASAQTITGLLSMALLSICYLHWRIHTQDEASWKRKAARFGEPRLHLQKRAAGLTVRLCKCFACSLLSHPWRVALIELLMIETPPNGLLSCRRVPIMILLEICSVQACWKGRRHHTSPPPPPSVIRFWSPVTTQLGRRRLCRVGAKLWQKKR